MAMPKPRFQSREESLQWYFSDTTQKLIAMGWRMHLNYITEEEKRRYSGKFLRHYDGTIEVL